jgi:3-oxoacyl-[acyl-carrier protein] reductase
MVKVLDVTLTGTFRCTRAVLTHMYEQGSRSRGQQLIGPRVGAHRQVRLITRRPRRGDGPHACAPRRVGFGVRVNAVAPSLAMHPFPEPGDLRRGARECAQSRELFGRSAETWEVANVIAFLASDYSSYMSGEIVSVSSQHP